jgi:hypothetical protein
MKTMFIIFFDCQGVVHKEFVPEGNTANAEFYKRLTDRHLKRIQRVRPAGFCSRDIFLLQDNAPAHKAASVCQFFTHKNVTIFITPLSSRFISARLFSVPQVENEVIRTPLCGCCSVQKSVPVEVNKVQKEEFSAGFQKLYDSANSVNMPMELILNK